MEGTNVCHIHQDDVSKICFPDKDWQYHEACMWEVCQEKFSRASDVPLHWHILITVWQ